MSNPSVVAGTKRKASLVPQRSSSNAHKRQKLQDARWISTESADKALSATGELNTASFIKAREFEIKALDKSMKNARGVLSTRAFQQVPRHLRRRTASHNAKKVPKRLRARARKEMVDDNTPQVTSKARKLTSRLRLRLQTAKSLHKLTQKRKTVRQRKREAKANALETDPAKHVEIVRIPRIKKNRLANPPLATSKFQRRQVNKTWLPTHLWHTKRAHMTRSTEPLWRMAIPLTSTEKSYRPSHRAASSRGCVAWDMSYTSTVGCRGTETTLDSLLKALDFDQGSTNTTKSTKWKAGSRFVSGWVRDKDKDEAIGMVDVIWCAPATPHEPNPGSDRRDKIVQMSQDTSSERKPKTKLNRQIFIRIHPSTFYQFWSRLLVVAKMQKPQVLVEDLRFEIGSIEITGPGSTEALVAVLKPTENEELIHKIWTNLSLLSNPALLPTNVLLHFNVSDPRLDPRPDKIKSSLNETDEVDLVETVVDWPLDKVTKPSQLFSYKARFLAGKLPAQKSIDRRRRDLLPGQTPQSSDRDPNIPIMLLAYRCSTSKPGQQGTWTVLTPWKCVDKVWRELVRCPLSSGGRPRFVGLDEKRQIAFERQTPWFPGDFPGTEAGKAWERSQAEDRFDRWLRRPPSRRLAWEALDLGLGRKSELGRGWTCDWEYLLKDSIPHQSRVQSVPVKKKTAVNPPSRDNEQLPLTQRQRKMAKARVIVEAEAEAERRRRNTSSPESDASIDLDDLTREPVFVQLQPTIAKALLQVPSLSTLPMKSAIVTVRITLLERGTPNAAARVYRLPTRKPIFDDLSTISNTTETKHGSQTTNATPPATQKSPSLVRTITPGNFKSVEKIDLRSQWLLQDVCEPASGFSKGKKERTNRHGLSRQHQHYEVESLRHINVLPKNAPEEIRRQFGHKPLSDEERQTLIKAEMAVQLEQNKVWDMHVPCPDAHDLIGYVTSGGYNLSQGKGTAIGGIWLQRVVHGWMQEDGPGLSQARTEMKKPTQQQFKAQNQRRNRERHLCVVRNAGESVGRLGIWELCE